MYVWRSCTFTGDPKKNQTIILNVLGVVTEAEVKGFRDQTDKLLEEEFAKAAQLTTMRFADWIDCPWPGFFKKQTALKCMPTGVSLEAIEHIANKFARLPSEDFELHKGDLLDTRKNRSDSRNGCSPNASHEHEAGNGEKPHRRLGDWGSTGNRHPFTGGHSRATVWRRCAKRNLLPSPSHGPSPKQGEH